MRSPIIAAALLCVLLAAAHAGDGQTARERTWAALPNWSGIWLSDDGIQTRVGLGNDPDGPGPTDRILGAHLPYNQQWEARFQDMHSAPAEPPVGKSCVWYFPGVMEGPKVFEALITPEETALIFEAGEIRHILTDGRLHPAPQDRWPTPWGDSIGHWDGGTLVIDTVAVAKDPTPFSPLVSDSAHFTERIRLVGKDRLEDRLTVTDPVALARPWTVTLPYRRVTAQDRIVHGDCAQNDRNPIVDGKLLITPPQR